MYGGIKGALFTLRAAVPNGALRADTTYKAGCSVPTAL